MSRGRPQIGTAKIERTIGTSVIEYEIKYSSTFYPGRTSGPPESCYPDESSDPVFVSCHVKEFHDPQSTKPTDEYALDEREIPNDVIDQCDDEMKWEDCKDWDQ